MVGVANKTTDYTQKDVTHLQLMVNAVWGITQRREFTTKYQQTFQALEQAKTSVVITNINGDIEYVNPFFVRLRSSWQKSESFKIRPSKPSLL